MQNGTIKIPIIGSMKRPLNPIEAKAEIENGRIEWKGGDIEIEINTKEFTSNCPTTGQPDFNRVKIKYKPDRFYIESKTLKFYLWSYREHGDHCEALAMKIAEHLFDAISPKHIEVIVKQNTRGGLKIDAKYIKTKKSNE